MADVVTAKPTNGVTPPTAVSRDALIAEMAKLADAPPTKIEEKAKPEPEAKPAAETDKETPSTDTAVEKESPADKETAKPEDKSEATKEEPDDETDAQTQRALDKIRAREKQAKESLAEERATWKREREREESRTAPRLAELEKFEALKARAKYDPASVLESLGLTEDDMESVSKAAWARSKTAKADPKQREAVEKTAKEREAADRIAALEKKLAEREKADTEREQQTRVQTMLSNYLDTVSKAVTDSAPLTRAHLAKNPEAARRALHQTAVDITDPDEPGIAPTPSAVIAAYEKKRQTELDDLGIDWRNAGKTPSDSPSKPSKTLGSASGATAAKKQSLSRQELDDEIRRQLREDKLE